MVQLTAFSFSVLSTILCDVQVPLSNAGCRVLGQNLKSLQHPCGDLSNKIVIF